MGPEWMVIAVAVGTLLAGVGGSMVAAARRPAPHQDLAEAAWRTAAETLGGAVEAGRAAALTPRRLVLEADLDGARVRLQTNVPVEPTVPGSTLGVARYALGAGPSFSLHPRGPGEGPGEAGVLGDGPVASRHRLTTDDPDALRALFDGPALAALDAFPRAGRLSSDGAVVRLEWDGAERRSEALIAAARLVARVSLFGVDALRELAGLDGALLRASDDGPYVAVLRDHLAVAIRATATRGGPSFSASAAAAGELPAIDVRLDAEGVFDGEVPPGVIDPDRAPSLGHVGASRLAVSEGLVRLTWVERPTRAQAEAGVQLVVAIAAGRRSGGAFR